MSQTEMLERARSPALADFGYRIYTRLTRGFRHRRMVRETSRAMLQMNDRQLADIGLSRSMIMNASWGSGRETP